MVWAAILYAGSASGLSWLVGRPLIELNSDRYSKEAELRHSMVRINEHIDAIALARGEADERRRIETDLGSLLTAVRRIYPAADQPRLGDRQLRVDDRRGADPDRVARLFRG